MSFSNLRRQKIIAISLFSIILTACNSGNSSGTGNAGTGTGNALVNAVNVSAESRTWQPVGISGFSTGSAVYQNLAVAPDGTPYVAYKDEAYDGKAVVMKFDGANWVNVGTPGFSADWAEYLSLAIGPDGTPYVAYSDDINVDKPTVMKFDGNDWVNIGPNFSDIERGYYENLVVAPNGKLYLAYVDVDFFRPVVMEFDGHEWSELYTYLYDIYYYTYGTTLAVAADSTLYLAFNVPGNTKNNIVTMTYDQSNREWKGVGVEFVGQGLGNIAVDSNAIPYIAYTDTTGKSSVKALDSKGNWAYEGSSSFSGIVSNQKMAISPKDNTQYITYQDSEHSNKTTVMQFDGANWINAGNPDFSTGSADYQSIAVGPDGIPYVAYSDSTQGGKTTVMKLGSGM